MFGIPLSGLVGFGLMLARECFPPVRRPPDGVRWEYGPEPAVRKRGRDGGRKNLGESTRGW